MAADDLPGTFRQWVLAKAVECQLGAEHFALREAPLPALRPGEALVHVQLVNLHPGIRTRMNAGMIPVGEPAGSNFALGEVVQSRDPAFKEGDFVACQAGWQDYQIISSRSESIGYGPTTDAVKALRARTRSGPMCYGRIS